MTTDPGRDWRAFAAPVTVSTAPPPAPTQTPIQGPPRLARRRGRPVPLALMIAVALSAFVVWHTGGGHGVAAGRSGFADQMTGGSSGGLPPVHRATSMVRLAPTVTAPAGSGGWTPMYGTAAHPIRWDPCLPIQYVVSGRPLFAGGNQMLQHALATVAQATGLRFRYVGRSDEPATTSRPAYQPSRYGEQWAPVLIAWTDAGQVPQLAGDVIGRGGADAAGIDGQLRLVSGSVYLDDPDLARLMAAPYGTSQVEGTMLHELGHLVGLGHSTDPNAVMYPTDHPNAGYDAGDLRGLAAMGAGPCYPTY